MRRYLLTCLVFIVFACDPSNQAENVALSEPTYAYLQEVTDQYGFDSVKVQISKSPDDTFTLSVDFLDRDQLKDEILEDRELLNEVVNKILLELDATKMNTLAYVFVSASKDPGRFFLNHGQGSVVQYVVINGRAVRTG